MKTFLFFLAVILVSCSNEQSYVYQVSEIKADYSAIENPRERWEAYNLADYAIEQNWACECMPPNHVASFIVSGKVEHVDFATIEEAVKGDDYLQNYGKKVYEQAKNKALTIDKAFQLIAEYKNTAYSIKVEYHPRFGYPTYVNINPSKRIVDEKIIYRFKDIKKIIR